MPIIRPSLPDPTDLVLQGEHMRSSSADPSPPSEIDSLINGGAIALRFSSLVPDEDRFTPMNSMIEGNRLSKRRLKTGELQIRANAGIATPTGAWLWLDYTPLMNPLLFASPRWTLSGVTRDSAGAPLGGCRVVVLETGRIAVGAAPVVAETISNGSGNYSVEVPLNTTYEAIAYLPGSPDVAGITRNDIVPVSNA